MHVGGSLLGLLIRGTCFLTRKGRARLPDAGRAPHYGFALLSCQRSARRSMIVTSQSSSAPMTASTNIAAYTTASWLLDDAVLITVPRPAADPAAVSSAITAPVTESGKAMRSAAKMKGSALGTRRYARTSSREAAIDW